MGAPFRRLDLTRMYVVVVIMVVKAHVMTVSVVNTNTIDRNGA